MRRFLAVLLIALALATASVYAWAVMSPLTLSIGSGAVTLVQAGPVTQNNATSLSPTLSNNSTAGTALLVFATSVDGITAAPAGWTQFISVTVPAGYFVQAWAYLNNPGGIKTVAFTSTVHAHFSVMSEWAGVLSISALETSGSATSAGGTTLTVSAAAATLAPTDLVIAGWHQVETGGPTTATFTSPAGFTRLVDNGTDNTVTGHMDFEYQLNSLAGSIASATLTSSVTTSSAGGFILVLKAAPPVTDQTAYLAY